VFDVERFVARVSARGARAYSSSISPVIAAKARGVMSRGALLLLLVSVTALAQPSYTGSMYRRALENQTGRIYLAE